MNEAITHPWSKTNLSSSSEKAGFAAATKEKEKNGKYLSKALSLGHLFRPIAMKSLDNGVKELKRH